MRHLVVLALLSALSFHSLAQNHGYAGQQARDLKALSPEEVQQYVSGAGMGYAKPAELNHYPGPMHVLEHADALALTERQREATQQLLHAHKAEARALGARLVAAERALEDLFLRPAVDAAALAEAVGAAAAAQGAYRLSHLETHRRLRAVLTDRQVARYDQLRGYAAGAPRTTKHKH